MAGVDSAGLAEVMQNVLANYSDADKARLAGVSPILPQSYPNFIRRSIERLCNWNTVFPPWLERPPVR
jgi:hypothetical protein